MSWGMIAFRWNPRAPKYFLHFNVHCLGDLREILTFHGNYVDFGGADEQKEAKLGIVGAWGRSE